MGGLVWAIVIGGVFVALGGLAYAGLWRSWTRRSAARTLFALFWLGFALLCEGTAALFFNGPLVPLALVLMVGFVLSGLLGFWMVLGGARWAIPRWARRAARR